GPRRDSVAGLKARRAPAVFEDAGAELMAEELDRRLGLQPALDAVIRECRNAQRQLRLGDARLNAERLDEDVSRAADRLGNVVEAHVVERVKAPGFHVVVPFRVNFWRLGQSAGTMRRLPPADI